MLTSSNDNTHMIRESLFGIAHTYYKQDVASISKMSFSPNGTVMWYKQWANYLYVQLENIAHYVMITFNYVDTSNQLKFN